MVVELKPVCDCGYIIEDLKFNKRDIPTYNEDNFWIKPADFYLTPECCPKCGEHINGIQVRRNLINLGSI